MGIVVDQRLPDVVNIRNGPSWTMFIYLPNYEIFEEESMLLSIPILTDLF